MKLRWLVLLAACAPASPPRAIVWPTETFFRAEARDFGGFLTTSLADINTHTLKVQPAWGDGAPLGYVVTEIWQNHPDVWVQPVYNLGATQTETLFGVDTQSTFYSPFWRAWLVNAPDRGSDYTHVNEINTLPMTKGPMVVCPIVPEGVRPNRPVDVAVGHAYVNGAVREYLSFGAERQVAEPYEGGELDGVVRPAELYLFARPATDGGRELLRELPVVLPQDAFHHAYVRRVDLVLDREAVFVPAGDTTGLREKLKGLGVHVPDVSASIDPAIAELHRGHVALDGGCFEPAAGFPASCEWLDSQAAIEDRVPAFRHVETDVTLTANPVRLP